MADPIDANAATPTSIVSEITGRLPPIKEPKPTSFLQWRGTKYMAMLLSVICFLALVFVLIWWQTRPTHEDVKAIVMATTRPGGGNDAAGEPLTPDKAAELLSKLRADHFEQCRDMFQIVVLSGLVPLFTLMAGYVFGKGGGNGGGDNADDDG